jgi:hypothetical protein
MTWSSRSRRTVPTNRLLARPWTSHAARTVAVLPVEPFFQLLLIEGRFFRPGTLRGRLLSARRSDDFLFLRYAIT